MPRVFRSHPPAPAVGGALPSDAPHYRFDPNLGNPRDAYTRAGQSHAAGGQPEVAGTFVAYVEGETIINTMHGSRSVAWRAVPGTPCVILGYWADGTVHLRWPAIAGHYRIDGRFPAWVVTEDPNARMAGGGRILSANTPAERRTVVPENTFAAAVLFLVLLLVVALPPTRDALAALASDLLHLGR